MRKQKSGIDYRPKRFLCTDMFEPWILLAACIIREAEKEKEKIINPSMCNSAASYTSIKIIKEAQEFLNSETGKFYKEVVNDYAKTNGVSCHL